MNIPSITQIIESLLEADNLPRNPKKVKISITMYQLLNSMREKNWIPSVEYETICGIPVEIDLDLFGYTYEFVY